MFVVRGTKKFRDRVRDQAPGPGEVSTTALGNWYVTVLFWKPQVALFVNEATLVPVLMPFAPSATILDRFPVVVGSVLHHHGLGRAFIESEVEQMSDHRLTKTANRSLIGMLNEFTFLAETWSEGTDDLIALSVRLAGVPCGPLDKRHGFPELELRALASRYPAS